MADKGFGGMVVKLNPKGSSFSSFYTISNISFALIRVNFQHNSHKGKAVRGSRYCCTVYFTLWCVYITFMFPEGQTMKQVQQSQALFVGAASTNPKTSLHSQYNSVERESNHVCAESYSTKKKKRPLLNGEQATRCTKGKINLKVKWIKDQTSTPICLFDILTKIFCAGRPLSGCILAI